MSSQTGRNARVFCLVSSFSLCFFLLCLQISPRSVFQNRGKCSRFFRNRLLIILSVGTYRCAVKVSILGSLGLHFGTLGVTLALFCGRRPPFGPFWRQGRILTHFPPRILVHFGVLLATEISKVTQNHKKTVSRKQCRKKTTPRGRPNRPNV